MTATSESAKQIREIMFSPLKRFQKEHCQQCGLNCNPTEQRFLACILAGLQDIIQRTNTLTQQRGSHL